MVARLDACREALVERWRKSWAYPWRATIVLFLCIVLSGGGICSVSNATNAGRGGAVAVALSLIILFFSENSGLRTFKLLTTTKPKLTQLFAELSQPAEPKPAVKDPLARLDALETQLKDVCEAFVKCIEISDRELFWNNVQLAAGSAIGTLAWGFGDMLHG